jgi:hypothetical protein
LKSNSKLNLSSNLNELSQSNLKINEINKGDKEKENIKFIHSDISNNHYENKEYIKDSISTFTDEEGVSSNQYVIYECC